MKDSTKLMFMACLSAAMLLSLGTEIASIKTGSRTILFASIAFSAATVAILVSFAIVGLIARRKTRIAKQRIEVAKASISRSHGAVAVTLRFPEQAERGVLVNQ